MFDFIIVVIVAYLLGSIPFGVVFAKMLGVGDLRLKGSGNIGATNALRVGGKKLGVLTLIADLLKGVIAVLIGLCFLNNTWMIYAVGLMPIIGHVWPVWSNFKGGKGVATTFGVLLVLNPPIFMCLCFFWLYAYFIAKVSAVAAIFSIIASSLAAALLFDAYGINLFMPALSVIILFKHLSNLKHLKA